MRWTRVAVLRSVEWSAAFTDGNWSSTRGRCGVAALGQLDELELDERRLSVRRSDGSRLAE
jgi:hypothetical protein